MAKSTFSKVRIFGIASAVPQTTASLKDLAIHFGADEVAKISRSIGVTERRIAPPDTCTSDLCFGAAQKLMVDIGWEPDSVDGLIFISQTPDYALPATSCLLQSRLGLSRHCAAFDIGLGCSGYVYGLWVAASLISGAGLKRILLLVGDTISHVLSPQDRATVPLFGDAGTATAIGYDPSTPPISFELGTDGTGGQHLQIPVGGHRYPRSVDAEKFQEEADGITRRPIDLHMNGNEIFTFTLREIPPLIRSILHDQEWTLEDPDAYVFHQANRFMLDYLGRKLKIPNEKLVLSLNDFGNTSSASIPLAITHSLRNRLEKQTLKLVLAGFGVGFSWGAALFECGPLTIPDLIEI